MGSVATWPKGPTYWTENGIPHVSTPFTWNLPEVREWLTGNLFHEVRVGGPAAYLKPEFFADMPNVTIEYSHPGVLQRVNPMATRTTTGCVMKKLTWTQKLLLKELSTEWRNVIKFSGRFHAVGNTLKALEKRGLIETRVDPECPLYIGLTTQEQARLVENKSA